MSIRNYPSGPRLYLDMDGVVADFGLAAKERGLHPQEYKLIPGAYANLLPIPGSVEGVNELLDLGFFIMLLTKIPSKNPYAASEKIMWLNKVLPRLNDFIIITPDKGCVGNSTDTLVDDHPEWANAHNFPGKIFQFGGEPSNKHGFVDGWPTLVALLRGEYD